MPRAVVQVPAFQEPDMGPVLDEIAAQRAPDGWTVGFECWVTPAGLSPEQDRTYQIAEQHDVFEARQAPDGFVSTLNEMHGAAADRGVDALVKWDADAPPRHPDVLAELLRPLEDPAVAAVQSRPIADRSPLGIAVNVFNLVSRAAVPRLLGQAHAMSTEAWRQAGPYDESIPQTKNMLVWTEVEYRMWRRLYDAGRIETPRDAIVENHLRRHTCQIERGAAHVGNWELSQWCGARGEDSFYPGNEPRR